MLLRKNDDFQHTANTVNFPEINLQQSLQRGVMFLAFVGIVQLKRNKSILHTVITNLISYRPGNFPYKAYCSL